MSPRSDQSGAGGVHEMPDGPAADDGLTQRQRLVLEYIHRSVTERGYPPSMREIGDAVGLTSPSSVKHQLASLERKGFIRRDPNRPRAIEVCLPDTARGHHRHHRLGQRQAGSDLRARSSDESPPVDPSWPSKPSRTSSRCPPSWLVTDSSSC